jgi:hypothetical protein
MTKGLPDKKWKRYQFHDGTWKNGMEQMLTYPDFVQNYENALL